MLGRIRRGQAVQPQREALPSGRSLQPRPAVPQTGALVGVGDADRERERFLDLNSERLQVPLHLMC
jgi:hypothetical protein